MFLSKLLSQVCSPQVQAVETVSCLTPGNAILHMNRAFLGHAEASASF